LPAQEKDKAGNKPNIKNDIADSDGIMKKAWSYMIPAVELIANQNKPTDRVFTIRKRYSRTPGSTIQFFLITSNWLFCCRSNQSFGYLQQLI
jgi:hypothetical protein